MKIYRFLKCFFKGCHILHVLYFELNMTEFKEFLLKCDLHLPQNIIEDLFDEIDGKSIFVKIYFYEIIKFWFITSKY